MSSMALSVDANAEDFNRFLALLSPRLYIWISSAIRKRYIEGKLASDFDEHFLKNGPFYDVCKWKDNKITILCPPNSSGVWTGALIKDVIESDFLLLSKLIIV